MPSPFPGMDPYIEDPEIWSDFHGRLAEEISSALNLLLQPQYIARLAPRATYELVEIGERMNIRPDAGVWHEQGARHEDPKESIAIAAAPFVSTVPMEVPLRLYTVEIIETGSLRLVTAIEVLSPVNKRVGHEAHKAYLRKRRQLLRSEAHLMEIDLLRAGKRPPLERPVPAAPYYVTLLRATRRPYVEVWPIQIWDTLPILPVPLLEPDPDVALDLNAAVAASYQRGAYDRMIDYKQAVPGPLTERENHWVNERMTQR